MSIENDVILRRIPAETAHDNAYMCIFIELKHVDTQWNIVYTVYIYITMQNLELPQSVQSNDITELHLKTSCQTSQARFCHLRPTQMKAFSRQWLFDRGLWLPALPPSEFTWKPKNDSVFASWGHGIQVFKWLFFSRFHDSFVFRDVLAHVFQRSWHNLLPNSSSRSQWVIFSLQWLGSGFYLKNMLVKLDHLHERWVQTCCKYRIFQTCVLVNGYKMLQHTPLYIIFIHLDTIYTIHSQPRTKSRDTWYFPKNSRTVLSKHKKNQCIPISGFKRSLCVITWSTWLLQDW